jgi:hypothetical protein
LIGYENFGPRIPGICIIPTFEGGSDKNFRGLKNCTLLLPWTTKVLSMSFSLLSVPWIENFGCEVTFLGFLNFQAFHWLKFCSSRPLIFSVKRALRFRKEWLWNHSFLDKAWIGYEFSKGHQTP